MLVTSFSPLKIYVYNQGIAQFANQRFSTDPNYFNDSSIHSTSYKKGDKIKGPGIWDFKLLKRFYEGLGVDFN